MLVECCAIVYNAGPTLLYHWVSGLCLLVNPNENETFSQCWFDAGRHHMQQDTFSQSYANVVVML